MRRTNWLAAVLIASVAMWTVGCGGKDKPEPEPKEPAGEHASHEHGAHEHGATTPEPPKPNPEPPKPEPTPTPTPDDTAEAGSAEAAVMEMVAALKAKQPGKLWEMMPASYQADVNEVVHTFAEKMPADAWGRGFGLLQKVFGALESKKEFVLNYPLLQFVPGFDAEELSEPYDGMVAVLQTLAKSDLSDLEKMRTADVGTLTNSVGGDLMTQMAAISAKFPEDPYQNEFMKAIEGMKVKTLESTDTTAKLEITTLEKVTEFSPDGEPTVTWEEKTEVGEAVKVEGKWIPKDLADNFADQIAEAKANLEQLSPEAVDQGKEQILAFIEMFEPAIDKIATAEDQEQFNNAVNELMQQAQALQGGGSAP